MKEGDYIFKGFSSFLEVFKEEADCRTYLEYLRWDNKPTCPHCKYNGKIYKLKNGKMYKCTNCNRNFTVTIGTIFQNTRIPIKKWFIAIYLLSSNKSGISSCQLAKYLEITQPNAWLILNKIRLAMEENDRFKEILEGVIECDESYIGGKNKNRHWDKKFKYSQGRSVVDKTPVFGILQRNGNVKVWTLKNLDGKKMRALIKKNTAKNSVVCTDEYRVYRGLDKYFEHKIIDHSKGQHKIGEIYHTNNIENFWNFIKREIIGTYRKVDKFYLNRYAIEAAFRYNTRSLTDANRFEELLMDFLNKRMTCKSIRKPKKYLHK